MADPPLARDRGHVLALASLGFVLAAVVLLLAAPPSTTPADPSTMPDTGDPVDIHGSRRQSGSPAILTDDRHAALVRHAGYRVRIVQRTSAGSSRATVAPSRAGSEGDPPTNAVFGIASLCSGVAALAVGVRRSRRTPRHSAMR